MQGVVAGRYGKFNVETPVVVVSVPVNDPETNGTMLGEILSSAIFWRVSGFW